VRALGKLALGTALGACAWVSPIADARSVGMFGSDGEIALANPAHWEGIKWPFLLDEWGIGRAFVCKPVDCGSEVTLYLRAKVGFCSCSAGITDNDDLDRVGDLKLLSDRFVGLAEGHVIRVAGMTGRSRPYEVSLPLWRTQTAVAIALHANCDAVVATVIADRDQLTTAERHALRFLEGDTAMQWIKMVLAS
jgi:hypothetical protein